MAASVSAIAAINLRQHLRHAHDYRIPRAIHSSRLKNRQSPLIRRVAAWCAEFGLLRRYGK